MIEWSVNEIYIKKNIYPEHLYDRMPQGSFTYKFILKIKILFISCKMTRYESCNIL